MISARYATLLMRAQSGRAKGGIMQDMSGERPGEHVFLTSQGMSGDQAADDLTEAIRALRPEAADVIVTGPSIEGDHLVYNVGARTSWCSRGNAIPGMQLVESYSMATCPICKAAYDAEPKLFWFICIQIITTAGPVTRSQNGTIVPQGRTTMALFDEIRDKVYRNAGVSDPDQAAVLAFTIAPNTWEVA